MGNTWQLQDAKNKLSELIDNAESGEPQTITRRGKRSVVVLNADDYDHLVAPRPRLIDALRNAPPGFDELDFSRDPSPIPEVLAL